MGFKPGDVILAVNDSEIGDLEFFTQFIHSSAVKKFKVWRKGQSLELIIPQYL
jgi:S1-C subfamily serine protease